MGIVLSYFLGVGMKMASETFFRFVLMWVESAM